jgi:arylsulfatase A-like enzyme
MPNHYSSVVSRKSTAPVAACKKGNAHVAAHRRPNVLLVTVDQWASDILGHAGHAVVETPTIDALARSGVRFTRAYAEVPICIPSRRSLMTGMSARRHGDRRFQPALAMPDAPTIASCFRGAGYQAYAVGKLHVYPPRNRIGFDDALVVEEGRGQLGIVDDYEIELTALGHAGEQFLHGMSNNEYSWRSWHLPEACHVTNWVARTMARTIKRRDPTRPAFWFASFTHPHPPLVPLASYLERYRGKAIDEAVHGAWSRDKAPYALRQIQHHYRYNARAELDDVKRAYYALCTHIDHQLRVIIGTLREEGVLDDTIIALMSDHGDMLGDHGLFAKRCLLQRSASIPMILVDVADRGRATPGSSDDRPAALHDVMPTLLDLCGIAVPPSCDGMPLLGTPPRQALYGESLEGEQAMRMVVTRRHKLIWYAAGNRTQLFDLEADPRECNDLGADPAYADLRRTLTDTLLSHLYGPDTAFVSDGRLVGIAEPPLRASQNRGLSGQRGLHFPPVPIDPDPGKIVGAI